MGLQKVAGFGLGDAVAFVSHKFHCVTPGPGPPTPNPLASPATRRPTPGPAVAVWLRSRIAYKPLNSALSIYGSSAHSDSM